MKAKFMSAREGMQTAYRISGGDNALVEIFSAHLRTTDLSRVINLIVEVLQRGTVTLAGEGGVFVTPAVTLNGHRDPAQPAGTGELVGRERPPSTDLGSSAPTLTQTALEAPAPAC